MAVGVTSRHRKRRGGRHCVALRKAAMIREVLGGDPRGAQKTVLCEKALVISAPHMAVQAHQLHRAPPGRKFRRAAMPKHVFGGGCGMTGIWGCQRGSESSGDGPRPMFDRWGARWWSGREAYGCRYGSRRARPGV